MASSLISERTSDDVVAEKCANRSRNRIGFGRYSLALRGRPYAAALMLQAEYHPEPPFAGGTLATTAADVGGMLNQMYLPLAERFRAIAKSSG